MNPPSLDARPWYREPWPWLLMAGPAAVIVASLATLVLAVQGSDALVAEDYYQQGLAINRLLARDRRAHELHIAAVAEFAGGEVRVRLASPLPPPAQLRLHIQHPTRASDNREVRLLPRGAGVYAGESGEPLPDAQGRQLVIEDRPGGWRIAGVLERGQSAARLQASP